MSLLSGERSGHSSGTNHLIDIQNTLEVAAPGSYLFLSMVYYRVGWQIAQMEALQMSAVWQEESHSACGWSTHHVPMNESLKYRTIQKALFQRYFIDKYDFSSYTISPLNRSAVWKRTKKYFFWKIRSLIWKENILSGHRVPNINELLFFPFYLNRDRFPCNLLRWHTQCLRQAYAAGSTACKGLGYITSVIFSHR